jgi:DHA3 family tetracycline resistance protein-like MFS transporter
LSSIRRFQKWDALRVYLLIKGTMSFAFALIFTVNLIYHAQTVGLNALQLVLVGTALEVTIFLFEIPTGVVADTYSRRLSVILGVFALGFGFIIEGATPTFQAVLLAQFVWGIGLTFISGALDAWIVDEIGTDRAPQVFLRGTQVEQVLSIFGIILSVIVGSFVINLPILLGGGLYLIAGLVLIVVMPENGFRRTPPTERETWQALFRTFADGIRLARSKHILLVILVVSFIFGLYSEGYDRLWTKHMLTAVTLPNMGFLGEVFWFGVLGIVGAMLSLIATEVLRRRLDESKPHLIPRLLFVLHALTMLGILVFAQASALLPILLCVWLISATRDASSPLYMAWLNQNTESSVRATMFSMSSQVNAIGEIGGGPVIGYIGLVAGVRVAISLAGLLLTPALVIFFRQQTESDTQAL